MKTTNTQETVIFTLSDGVVIERSSVKTASTGYLGSCFCPGFSKDPNRPFQAAVCRPEGVILKNPLGGKKTWVGGFYSDAREAAYVAALFRQDPVGIDHLVISKGVKSPDIFVDFPPDLYNLPTHLSLEDAQRRIEEHQKSSVIKTSRKKDAAKPVQHRSRLKDDKLCNDIWPEICANYNIPELAVKFTKDVIVKARNSLTFGEFKSQFNLA